MELMCKVTVKPRSSTKPYFWKCFWGSVIVGCVKKKSNSSNEPLVVVRTLSKNSCDGQNKIYRRIRKISTTFLNLGRAKLYFKNPNHKIYLSNADPARLKTAINYITTLLTPDSSQPNLNIIRISKSALKRPINHVDVTSNEEYVKTIVAATKEDWEHVISLKICRCLLTSAPAAVGKIKNLRSLRLERVRLRSSHILEIESKELKELHLRRCKMLIQVSTLFQNNVCFKDSLTELYLEYNRWSQLPHGVFECRNLFKLSLKSNRFTELPDRFNDLPHLKMFSVSSNLLRYLPPSIMSLRLKELVLTYNRFVLDYLPPILRKNVHTLKELGYRAVLNHKLMVEGVLPMKWMKELADYRHCMCGCKYVGEGEEVSFLFDLKTISPSIDYSDGVYGTRFPLRGTVCNSLLSCFPRRFYL